MKVWIFQTGEPLHCDDGAPRPMRAMNLSNTLIDRGHNVVLWSSSFYHQEKRHRSRSFKRIEISDYLTICLIPSPGYKKNIGFGRLYDHYILARNLKRQLLKYDDHLPDIIFVGYPPIETASVVIDWANVKGVPTILDVKDLWPSLFLEPFPDVVKPILKIMLFPYFHMSKRTMKGATAFSSMSKAYLDWMTKFSERELTSSDVVIPLTSKLSTLTTDEYIDAKEWWQKFSINNEKKRRFCFIGSFMSVFDFSSVKNTADRFQRERIDCTFIICGNGGFFNEIKQQFDGLNNVIFPGWIDRPKIKYLSECCSGSIIPYKNIENFTLNIPNKVIDAIGLGLPILTTLNGEVGRLVNDENIGFSCNSDSGISMYEAMKYLLDNPKSVLEMSERAKSLYARDFSYETVYGNLVSRLELLGKNIK